MKHLLILLLLATSAQGADLFTDKTLTVPETNLALIAAGIPSTSLPRHGGHNYAVFRRSMLHAFHAQFLWALPRPRGQQYTRYFNCLGFSEAFAVEALKRLGVERSGWQGTTFTRPALLIVAYTTDRKTDAHGHCLLLILTEEGPVWWDAQAGLARKPSASELATAWRPQM